jgi:cyclohexyl-isocyanide hydratase
MKIAIFVFPGVEELDFVGVYEVLAKAEAMRKENSLNLTEPIELEILSNQQEIMCANGMIVKAHQLYQGLNDYDGLIIPGGKGIRALKNNKDFLEDIKKFSKSHLIASVCSGALILAWAGVLKGKRATTHHLHRKKLEEFCEVVPEKVVIDKNVITAGGVSSSLELGLKLLEIFYGNKIAEEVAERIEYQKLMY